MKGKCLAGRAGRVLQSNVGRAGARPYQIQRWTRGPRVPTGYNVEDASASCAHCDDENLPFARDETALNLVF